MIGEVNLLKFNISEWKTKILNPVQFYSSPSPQITLCPDKSYLSRVKLEFLN